MDLLPFGTLPPYTPRKFVPADIHLDNWSQLEPLLLKLEERVANAANSKELEAALIDCSELQAALDEESSRRYIAMTCHTDNSEAEKAYLYFVEEIEPKLKPHYFKLSQLYLNSPHRTGLPEKRYFVFDRNTRIHVELYRDENVPLETEEAKLCQQYQKISGAMTVNFRGEEKTLVQMARYLEEPDRALREEAWTLVAQRRLTEVEKFDNIFDELLKLRQQIARNAGFDSYTDYSFRAKARFDYTPEDCIEFHRSIESEVMPVLKDLQEQRRQQLGLDKLRPWDLSVDPLNRPPLRPFEQVEILLQKTTDIFQAMDPDLGREFADMGNRKLLDLANRKGKAPGGYQSTLSEARLPFIFMNAVGVQRDVETLLHEAGHAFHAIATQDEDIYHYRSAPIEFCEVASMSMELLGNEYLEKFYAPDDQKRARRDHLEGILELFPWVATVDAFQHWLYANPGHDRTQRRAAWQLLMDRFGGLTDWSGHEQARANLWHRQLHIFLHPFYYVEYAIAQLGALQVWANSKKDPKEALAQYKRGLQLGGSRPLPELFQAAGCRFDFSLQTFRPLMQMVRQELQKLT